MSTRDVDTGWSLYRRLFGFMAAAAIAVALSLAPASSAFAQQAPDEDAGGGSEEGQQMLEDAGMGEEAADEQSSENGGDEAMEGETLEGEGDQPDMTVEEMPDEGTSGEDGAENGEDGDNQTVVQITENGETRTLEGEEAEQVICERFAEVREQVIGQLREDAEEGGPAAAVKTSIADQFEESFLNPSFCGEGDEETGDNGDSGNGPPEGVPPEDPPPDDTPPVEEPPGEGDPGAGDDQYSNEGGEGSTPSPANVVSEGDTATEADLGDQIQADVEADMQAMMDEMGTQ